MCHLKRKIIMLLRNYIQANIAELDSLNLVSQELYDLEYRLQQLKLKRKESIEVNQQEVKDLEDVLTTTKSRVQKENVDHSNAINITIEATAGISAAVSSIQKK